MVIKLFLKKEVRVKRKKPILTKIPSLKKIYIFKNRNSQSTYPTRKSDSVHHAGL